MSTAADQLNWRHVDSMLWDWGKWLEQHSDETGYPSRSAIAGVIDVDGQYSWFRVRQLTAKGQGDLIFGGHRILCRDMPPRIREINLMVNRLSAEQYDAVLAQYGLVVHEDGYEFSKADKAHTLGISVVAFDERLRRARIRIGEILANATGYEYV